MRLLIIKKSTQMASSLSNFDSLNYEATKHLSVRIKTFIVNHLSGMIPVEAVKASGFYGTEDELQNVANDLMERDDVIMELRRRRAMAFARADIDHNRMVNELASIAFFDPGDLYDVKGELLPMHKIPERARRALEVFATGVNVSGIKVCSKIKALEMLGKYMGMFGGKNEIADDTPHAGSVSAFDIEERTKMLLETRKKDEIDDDHPLLA